MKTKLFFLAIFALSLFSGSKLMAQCSAVYTYSASPAGLVTFTASGANPASTAYFWSFGNGTSGMGQTATCQYNAVGPYTVCLYVVDTIGGCSDSTCQSITLPGVFGCQASFFIYEDTLNPGSHTYIGVNTSLYNPQTTFDWAWGDGTYATGFNPPSHTYPAAGTYNICLMISGGGCVDTFCSSEIINKTAANMYSVTFGASPTGINQVSESNANHVYPNPANASLYIQGNANTLYQYEIYTISGSKVCSGKAKGQEEINVSSLASNLYLVKITDAVGNKQFAKFSKQ